jgi:cytoskeletal protein CcmA (bactofilin family)
MTTERREPMTLRWRACQAVAVGLLGLSAACDRHAPGGENSRVMGDIEVAAGEHTADVSTVNGSIHIRENAVVGNAHTVNGSISVDPHASTAELETVNGSIRLGQGARASGEVHTVNGELSLANDAEVSGSLQNVNGAIRVAAAHVGGSIETVAGGIELGPDAHVDGGIHVHADNSLWGWDGGNVPRIVIGPGCRVGGALNFERKVSLYLSDNATVGPVQGATPVRYSGERPPG